MSEASKPLPCPFCGSVGRMAREECPDGFGTFCRIECTSCGARSKEKYHTRGSDCPGFYVGVREEWNRRADLSVAEAARVLLEARNEAKQVPVGARRTPQQVSLMKFKETALRSLAKEPSHD